MFGTLAGTNLGPESAAPGQHMMHFNDPMYAMYYHRMAEMQAAAAADPSGAAMMAAATAAAMGPYGRGGVSAGAVNRYNRKILGSERNTVGSRDHAGI